MIQKACDSVSTAMKQTAEELGAETILLFATSAVRDAKNQRALSDALLTGNGIGCLDILLGGTEAELSFYGAAGESRSGMIDIGGGSTEIVIGKRDTMEFSPQPAGRCGAAVSGNTDTDRIRRVPRDSAHRKSTAAIHICRKSGKSKRQPNGLALGER